MRGQPRQAILCKRVRENPDHSLAVIGMELRCQACGITLNNPGISTTVRNHCKARGHIRNLAQFPRGQKGGQQNDETAAAGQVEGGIDGAFVTEVVAGMMGCAAIATEGTPLIEDILNRLRPDLQITLDPTGMAIAVEQLARRMQAMLREEVHRSYHCLVFDELPALDHDYQVVIASYVQEIADAQYKPQTVMYDLLPIAASGPRGQTTSGDVGATVFRTIDSRAWEYTVAIVSDGSEVHVKAWQEHLRMAFPHAIWVSCIGQKLGKVSHRVATGLQHLEALMECTDRFMHLNKRDWYRFEQLTADRPGYFGAPTSHRWEEPFELALFWQSRLSDLLPFLQGIESDDEESQEAAHWSTPAPAPDKSQQAATLSSVPQDLPAAEAPPPSSRDKSS
jgi:hypothetical protein